MHTMCCVSQTLSLYTTSIALKNVCFVNTHVMNIYTKQVPYVGPLTFALELKIGTPVTPAIGHVYTYLDFLLLFYFPVQRRYGMDGQTHG